MTLPPVSPDSVPMVRDGHRRHASQAGLFRASGHHGGRRAGGGGEPQIHPPISYLKRGLW